jgi:hypothetical protein
LCCVVLCCVVLCCVVLCCVVLCCGVLWVWCGVLWCVVVCCGVLCVCVSYTCRSRSVFAVLRSSLQAVTCVLACRYMGTEENILSLLYYRYPQLVHDFDNGAGGNCHIFSTVGRA